MLYEVGEILYLLDDQRAQVVPFYVEEQIVKKTKSGESVLYVIRQLDGDKRTADLSKLTLYRDPNEVERVMVERASAAISDLVLHTVERAEKAFGASKQEDALAQEVVKLPDEMQDGVQVTLPDGRVARLRTNNIVQDLVQR